MGIKIKVEAEKEVAFLKVNAGVRYWDDGIVDGEPDSEAEPRMPFAKGESWEPVIEIATGRIIGWPSGVNASTHYKVCDAGVYTLLDEDHNEVKSIDGYVPDILCPADSGYGDYIIMHIDAEGYIKDWRVTLDEFQRNGDDD